jgi:hypothetical protein
MPNKASKTLTATRSPLNWQLPATAGVGLIWGAVSCGIQGGPASARAHGVVCAPCVISDLTRAHTHSDLTRVHKHTHTHTHTLHKHSLSLHPCSSRSFWARCNDVILPWAFRGQVHNALQGHCWPKCGGTLGDLSVCGGTLTACAATTINLDIFIL